MISAELSSGPQSIDIRDFRGEYCDPPTQVITGETLEIQNEPVHVQLRAVTYYPTRINGLDGGSVERDGSRTMFGIFVCSGTANQLVELVRGPSEFSIGKHACDWKLAQEKRALEVIAGSPSPFVVGPLPGAYQTNERIYESTAPGILVSSALTIVADAYRQGELSTQETALILTKIHGSGLHALAQLHNLGIKHHHAHVFPGNFNVDIRTSNVTIFDYTLAASKNRPDTFIKVDYPVHKELNVDNLEEDVRDFELSWQDALEAIDLSMALLERLDLQELDAATAKLEPTIVRAALRSIGLADVSESDVRRVIELQESVISNAPDVSYPKNTLSERLKIRLTLAKLVMRRPFF